MKDSTDRIHSLIKALGNTSSPANPSFVDAVEAVHMRTQNSNLSIDSSYKIVQEKNLERIIKLLVGIGEEAVVPLIQALSDANPRIRMGVAEALGRIGDPRALKVLRRRTSFWKESKADVRKSAKKAIAYIESGL